MSNTGGREDISRFELYGFHSSGNGVDSSIKFSVARACAPEARRGLRTHTLRLSAVRGPTRVLDWTRTRYSYQSCVGARVAQGNGLQSRTVAGSNPARRSIGQGNIYSHVARSHSCRKRTRMSDVFEGPGHWMASDGKWYPPERHPDSGYRERFAAVPPPLPKMPEPEVLTPPEIPTETVVAELRREDPVEEKAAPEFPSVELHQEHAPEVSTPLVNIHQTGIDTGTAPISFDGKEDFEIENVPTAPSFSVASKDFGSVGERPVFDGAAPPSVTESPKKSAAQRVVMDHGTVELELELEIELPSTPRTSPLRSPTGVALSTSTALAVIPSTQPSPGVNVFDRVLAAALFCAGVAMIVGTFLDWTSGSLVQTGWDRGDGIATIIAGVLGSATAGPIYVGYHHIVPKIVAIIAGLVGLVVVGLTAVSVLFDNDASDTSLAIGFFVVLAGAAAMTLGGLVHRIGNR